MKENAYKQALALGSDPQECVCLNIRQASRVLTQYYDEALKPAGISITQFSLLMPLEAKGLMRISELAELQLIERTTLTRNLAVMEREGLVRIAAGDDKRTRMVQITDKGKELMREVVPVWNQAQTRVLSRLGKGNWDSIRDDVQGLIRELR